MRWADSWSAKARRRRLERATFIASWAVIPILWSQQTSQEACMPLDDEVRGKYQFSDRDDDVDDLGYGGGGGGSASYDDDDEEDGGWMTHKDESDDLWDSTDDVDDDDEEPAVEGGEEDEEAEGFGTGKPP